jgi:gamma-glutamyl-gamma-aminobutyrate hydrolase PuuD
MKIAITPRFEKSKFGDGWYAYDRNLIRYILRDTPEVEITLLSPEGKVDLTSYNLLVLQGGNTPGENIERDEFEFKLYREFQILNKKIIGICRGAQMMAISSGGKIAEVSGHINVDANVTHNLKINKKSFGKCFHNFGVKTLSNDWEILASCPDDSSFELFVKKNRKEIGLMFHPERIDNGISFSELLDFLDD